MTMHVLEEKRSIYTSEEGDLTMKNVISRRSFLKAAGIIGASAALAA